MSKNMKRFLCIALVLAMVLPVCVYVSGCVFQHTHFIDGKTAVG